MLKILFFSLLATFLFAQSHNPKVYSALGDAIYDNVDKIDKLKYIEPYYSYVLKINNYVTDVKEAKQLGFDVQSGYKAKENKNYLKKIRNLSKINNFFLRNVNASFKESIKNEKNEIFIKLVNSGLINTKKFKNDILSYYKSHSEKLDAAGIIQEYLDEEEMLRIKNLPKKVKVRKKETQAQKIKRLREKDRLKKEAIKKNLEEELNKKKRDIRNEQIRELNK